MPEPDIKVTISFDNKEYIYRLEETEKKTKRATEAAREGFTRFGLETEGVLQKLARNLSLTDVAAGAVFASFASFQHLITSSLKAYREQEEQIYKTTGAASAYLTEIHKLEDAIKRNNVLIGEHVSGLDLIQKRYQLIGTTLVRLVSSYVSDPSFANWLKLAGAFYGFVAAGGPLAFQITPGDGTPNPYAGPIYNQPSYDDFIRAESARFAEEAKRTEEFRRRQAEGRTLYEIRFGNIPRAELRGGDYGPREPRANVSAPFSEFWLGFNADAIEEYQRELRRLEDTYREVSDVSHRFASNLVGSLTDAAIRGANIMEGIKEAFISLLEDILQRTVARSLGSAISSFILGPLAPVAGAAAGLAPQPLSAHSLARAILPAIRYEISRGR